MTTIDDDHRDDHRPDAAVEPRTVRPLGRVLVTGAASGLGRAVAAAVAAAGGSPLLLDRVDPRTDAVPALADAPAVVVDLAETRAAEDAVARARRPKGSTPSSPPRAPTPADGWRRCPAPNGTASCR